MWASRIVLALVVGVQQAVAFAVYAHFMVSNTKDYNSADWLNEIDLAQRAGIDGFALNIAKNEDTNKKLDEIFTAAASRNFQLFFSFDYAGNGAWDKEAVKSLINQYKGWSNNGQSIYVKHNSKPLVSTFEGPSSANDWHEIKTQTGCFFVPDWSSEGAKKATGLGNGVADGLFSWAAWPAGPNDMNTYGDASYMQFLKQANRPSYMMPVSPWFYTNLPGFLKNWLWRGDRLWFDRWVQVLYLARIQKDFPPPLWAQIISWNDFGEAHYIGPILNKATYALNADEGKAPFNYANNVPHGGWRLFLPFLIQLAKTGQATVGTQGVQIWHRNSELAACGFAETVGNTATQMQLEYSPTQLLADKVFYSALLEKEATVTVTVGGVAIGGGWSDKPGGGAGIYHGSSSFKGRTGEVVVTVAGIATVKGVVPIGGCTAGSQNFNPYVNNANGPASSTVVNINNQVCVDGFGVGGFVAICKYACTKGYCPVTACTCTRIGPQPALPTPLFKNGYPSNGDRDFEGLCSFAVNYGYLGTEHQTASIVVYTSTAGVGLTVKFDSMCKFSCKYGWCPMLLCRPTSTGVINSNIPGTGIGGDLRDDLPLTDLLLCRFTMIYGQANAEVCFKAKTPTTTKPQLPIPTSIPTSGPTLYVDPEIYGLPAGGVSTIQCSVPCTIVLPDTTLPTPTTIAIPPYTTTLEVGWFEPSTYDIGDNKVTITVYKKAIETTTIKIPPITTTVIEVWNVVIDSDDVGRSFYPKSSLYIPPVTITHVPDSNQVTKTIPPRTRIVTPPPYPWPEVSEDRDEEDQHDDTKHRVKDISLIHKVGPHKPVCRIGCGHHCLLFCDRPCLFNCKKSDKNWDDLDPIDPASPPPLPPGGPPTSSPPPPGVTPASYEADPRMENDHIYEFDAKKWGDAGYAMMQSMINEGIFGMPAPSQPAQPPASNYFITISRREWQVATEWRFVWDIHNTAMNSAADICDGKSEHSEPFYPTPGGSNNPGDIKGIKIGATQSCEYKANTVNNDDPGTFNCPGFAKPVSCTWLSREMPCSDRTSYVAQCQYYSSNPLKRRWSNIRG
ncbi:unnamed protein product [Periconia digitata]|uniref:Uncharacterized protein n=1 Tax=Periconia digitata TaxID=1303443 RepID=A0A9W4UWU4_9PLEO|nr:unnamed protein product [Periconia digitata]